MLYNYWFTKHTLVGYLEFIILLLSGAIGLAGLVYLNYWRGDFWESIADHNIHQFWFMIGKFTLVAFILIITSVYSSYLTSKISLNWRTHLASELTQLWTKNPHDRLDSPDQRIAEDVRGFTSLTLNLIGGISGNLITAIAFGFILFNFGWVLLVLGIGWTIINYLGSWLIGKKLIDLTYVNQRSEANYRFGLAKVRCAQDDGDHDLRYDLVYLNTLAIFTRQKILNFFINSTGQISIIFPFIVLYREYFYKALSFGALMQCVNAMGSFIDSLNYLVNSYSMVVEWKASKQRLDQFINSLESI